MPSSPETPLSAPEQAASDRFDGEQTAEKDVPRIGQTATVTGTVRTVEALWPDGHYRITLDVAPKPERRVVDGRTDNCPAPGYAGNHTAVGAGAISSPYMCHGCGVWFTIPETTVIPPAKG